MASEWGFAVISTIRWAVFLRGDRQDQQKKLSDEQLVLNAQSDKTAIGELIARYICTVEFLAKKYGTEVHEDLVQEGLMGLLGAVRTYREDKNAKFSTYATKCIKIRSFRLFTEMHFFQAARKLTLRLFLAVVALYLRRS